MSSLIMLVLWPIHNIEFGRNHQRFVRETSSQQFASAQMNTAIKFHLHFFDAHYLTCIHALWKRASKTRGVTCRELCFGCWNVFSSFWNDSNVRSSLIQLRSIETKFWIFFKIFSEYCVFLAIDLHKFRSKSTCFFCSQCNSEINQNGKGQYEINPLYFGYYWRYPSVANVL